MGCANPSSSVNSAENTQTPIFLLQSTPRKCFRLTPEKLEGHGLHECSRQSTWTFQNQDLQFKKYFEQTIQKPIMNSP